MPDALPFTLYIGQKCSTSQDFPYKTDRKVEEKNNLFLEKSQITVTYLQKYWDTHLPKYYPTRNQTYHKIFNAFLPHTRNTEQ